MAQLSFYECRELGFWITDHNFHKCADCGFSYYASTITFEFCPKCGRHMILRSC